MNIPQRGEVRRGFLAHLELEHKEKLFVHQANYPRDNKPASKMELKKSENNGQWYDGEN